MSTSGEVSGARRRDLFNQAGAPTYPTDPLGWFVEPAWTVEALWRFQASRGGIPEPAWDPACGLGTIPDELRRLGIHAIGSDVVDRAGGRFVVRDFLQPLPTGHETMAKAIVTNPPYDKLAERFVLRALDLVGYVAVLVQAKFPYSQGRYDRLFKHEPPSHELRLVDRPSMPPGHLRAELQAKGGKMDFLWMIWDWRTAGGDTTAHWIRRAA